MPTEFQEHTTGSRAARLRASLEAAYRAVDSPPYLPLLLAFCLYAYVVFGSAGRPLWHDELYTYYSAKTPGFSRLVETVLAVELQPPLLHILTALSLRLFGDSNLATRIPSMLAFLVASYCLFRFVRVRLGRLYGLCAMLTLWVTPFFTYATEARPYALLLAFFGIAMVGWQESAGGRRSALAVLACGVLGMLLSHVFGVVLLGVLGFAELVRLLENRRWEWPVPIAMIVPVPALLLYVPAIRRFAAWDAIPAEFQASWLKMLSFYSTSLGTCSLVLLAALAAALLAAIPTREVKPAAEFTPRASEAALVFALWGLPIALNLLLMRNSGAFWPRYSIATGIGYSLTFVYVLAKATRNDRFASGIASLVLIAGIIVGDILVPAMPQPEHREMTRSLTLAQLDPRLPLVSASGLVFLEMNQREDASLLSHVYYLKDRTAAIRYANATIFENTDQLYQYFPIRAKIESYATFVKQWRHFLVLCQLDSPEDWLVPKLLDEGARLEFLGELHRGYRSEIVFDINLPPVPGR